MRRSHARTRTGARTWRRCGDDAARQGRARVLRSAACSGAHVCVRPPADMCAPRGLQARRRCLAPRRVLRVPRRCSAPGAALKGKLLRHADDSSSSRRVPGTRPRMHWRARPLAPGWAVHTGLCYAGAISCSRTHSQCEQCARGRARRRCPPTTRTRAWARGGAHAVRASTTPRSNPPAAAWRSRSCSRTTHSGCAVDPGSTAGRARRTPAQAATGAVPPRAQVAMMRATDTMMPERRGAASEGRAAVRARTRAPGAGRARGRSEKNGCAEGVLSGS